MRHQWSYLMEQLRQEPFREELHENVSVSPESVLTQQENFFANLIWFRHLCVGSL